MYDCWRLCPDFSVCMDRRHGTFDGPYQWTRCELTSPILNEDNYDTEINTVCSDLKNARIHINKNSAVHVHVGLRGASFSLLTIKKFATFYWLTEDAFLKLHHPCRHWNKYCFRLTIYSSLATKTLEQLREEEECLDPKGLLLMGNWIPTEELTELQRARFRRIWGSTRIEEIGYLMGAARRVPVHQAYDRRGSVGFLRFLPRGQFGANINTFEWRQMSSTLDAEHIIQWAEACIFFTDFCRTASEVVFKSHIAKVIEKCGDYSGIELIRDLHANTDILEKKLESWKQDASFCEDKSGAALFVPRSPPYSDSPSGDVF
ncbi:hypothetical protein SAMD00023353_2500790 [Rosellinia necatrix]|uniref:Uncharacterized protein n=1 Tax=Rosellinia necatrix TaxID=77044 RepID=A0A1S8A808_ROSNE|nr:hypothetical protein SAMD00023353_2500790 [Rosellinia necatrix]